MSEVRLEADDVSYQIEGDNQILAFFNDQNYVFFQRHCEPGHKEDDGVYIELNNEQHGGFDVIEAVTLSCSQLAISLKSPLYKMPAVNRIVVDVDLSVSKLQEYGQRLQQLFEQRLVTVEIVS